MPIKDGDVILVHYTIKKVENGKEEVVDTTREDIAKEYGIYDPNKTYREAIIVVGKSKLLDAIEEVIREMDVGEKREILAPPEKAFGPYRPDLVIKVPKKQLRRMGVQPVVGEEVNFRGHTGRIVRVTERFAYIDFNHPLAGKEIKIELEIVGKLETEEEKIKYLAVRWFGVDKDKVEVSVSDSEAELALPPEVVMVNDLESILQSFLSDVYDLTNIKELTIKIKFEFKREEGSVEAGGEQVSEAEKEGETGDKESIEENK